MMKRGLVVLMLLAASVAAQAGMRITEWMYKGEGGEFVEFTNTGTTAIDMTGWSYDDDSQTSGGFDLSGLGVVAAGESVIITEDKVSDFRQAWNLSDSVKVLGEYENKLGRGDEINLFDGSDELVDRLTYEDDGAAGGPRTDCKSGNIPGDYLGANNASKAVLSFEGDVYGSYKSTNGDLGNPGSYVVPEPATLALLGLGGLLLRRKK